MPKDILQILESYKAAIASTLAKGDRVELIPTKDGVRVNRIRREEVKR
jgi:hypothetical protein